MNEHVVDAEASVSDPMVSGSIDNPRLRSTLADIDAGAYACQVGIVGSAIADMDGSSLRDALVMALGRIVDTSGIPIAMAQIVVMAFYRGVRKPLTRLDPGLVLDEIRAMPVGDALRLMQGFRFAAHRRSGMPDAMRARCLARLNRTLFPDGADRCWSSHETTIEREPWIVEYDGTIDVIQNALRNRFCRQVFVDYLGPDNQDERTRHEHHLVIDMLEDAIATPQLHQFLQGEPPGQRRWRVARLTEILTALHDIGSRIGTPPPEDTDIVAAARALARTGVGPSDSYRNLLLACCLSPFTDLVDRVRMWGPRLRIPRISGPSVTTATSLRPVARTDMALPAVR